VADDAGAPVVLAAVAAAEAPGEEVALVRDHPGVQTDPWRRLVGSG
jgi:hypothetical protein